ncbi:hypothetical protein COHA_010420 [Chlorella ohadii]|uniref:Prolyl 4-hydroxylase alpha subunit Fe(2+) 2OG dioxygenase domain-containing protein n=1 Tax=Chlorella ohadii TaxID=2649997 RepID=A0AAD5DGC7_9CHLO|nr:hypothetical protein COHA_010420 [Chlorella ohadii]
MGRPGKRAKVDQPSGGELARALNWLNSYNKVSKWMAQYDLNALVDAGGGIVKVSNFLPPFVAEGALQILQRLPPGRWNDTAADEDYTHNNIAHRFWSVKGATGGGPALEALLRAFSLLAPEQFNAFSAARYETDHHIAPHDDRAYTPVQLDSGEVISCSRDLTCVYYLTKDWTEDMGGAFVDLEADPEPSSSAGANGAASSGGGSASSGGGSVQQHPAQQRQGRLYVPEFNSAVFFRVPRYHRQAGKLGYWFSVFGWFLQPGQLYDLFTGEQEDIEQQIAYRQRSRAAAEAAAAEAGGAAAGGAAAAAAPAVAANGGLPAAGAAAAAGEGDGQQQREQQEEAAELEGVIEPQRCKLGQRLLARAAERRQARAKG